MRAAEKIDHTPPRVLVILMTASDWVWTPAASMTTMLSGSDSRLTRACWSARVAACEVSAAKRKVPALSRLRTHCTVALHMLQSPS